MKITQVQFMESVRVGNTTETVLNCARHEIHFENGLIVVTLENKKVYVPMSNVRCWLVADEAPKASIASSSQEMSTPKRGRPAKAE